MTSAPRRTKSAEVDGDLDPAGIKDWLDRFRGGDDAAAAQLWRHCVPEMVAYSRRRLPAHLRRAIDEEDIVLSAFNSLCEGISRGDYTDVRDAMDLLRLMTCITQRKTTNHIKHETRLKRGGGNVRGDSAFAGLIPGTDSHERLSLPAPQWLAEQTEACQQRLDQLDDPVLETIAVLRLEGYSVEEIGHRLGCVRRTVERRLALIRRIWDDGEAS